MVSVLYVMMAPALCESRFTNGFTVKLESVTRIRGRLEGEARRPRQRTLIQTVHSGGRAMAKFEKTRMPMSRSWMRDWEELTSLKMVGVWELSGGQAWLAGFCGEGREEVLGRLPVMRVYLCRYVGT